MNFLRLGFGFGFELPCPWCLEDLAVNVCPEKIQMVSTSSLSQSCSLSLAGYKNPQVTYEIVFSGAQTHWDYLLQVLLQTLGQRILHLICMPSTSLCSVIWFTLLSGAHLYSDFPILAGWLLTLLLYFVAVKLRYLFLNDHILMPFSCPE